MQNGVETIQIDVPQRLFRAMQFRPFLLVVSALTGVSVTFCPLFLFWLGAERASYLDWRVITCFVITYLVPMVYMRFGGPVLGVAWKRHSDSAFGKPGTIGTQERP